MLTYENERSDIAIVFGTAALDHFARNRQLRPSSAEAGGQLFATFDDGVAHIDLATGPRPTDHRSRYVFRPDRRSEQLEIKTMFMRGLHYVGDWHTHPTQIPQPSIEDLRNIRAAVRQSVHELKGFLLVVVGNAPFPVGLSVTLDTGDDALRLQVAATSTASTL
ncbi:Mov34/MPN/PAD-1 family protein [Leptolyngbya sp. 7M]|uniref:Mov34/MPN/PAD-1 family protein n=1 Tax=Leptolyngbya sp. 7M TaxID=2812896 RepID=UPI001B8C45EE|nr:Mov34/MPN/PAD-1 family protein [Leptolyngbya sp. 7M]QYO66019.1 Mov34/MPN/PAD-1 family protein [Leptolyngbya sp. 7M]